MWAFAFTQIDVTPGVCRDRLEEGGCAPAEVEALVCKYRELCTGVVDMFYKEGQSPTVCGSVVVSRVVGTV